MSVCHRLALSLAGIHGGGGVILDCTHTEVDQTVSLLFGFNE